MLWEIGRKGGKYEISALAAFPEIVLKTCVPKASRAQCPTREHTRREIYIGDQILTLKPVGIGC